MKNLKSLLFCIILLAASFADVGSIAFINPPTSIDQSVSTSVTLVVKDTLDNPTSDVVVTLTVISGNVVFEYTATTDGAGQIYVTINSADIGEIIIEAQAAAITTQIAIMTEPLPPAAPGAPTLSWINGGINSTANQYVKIDRPTIPTYVDTWVINVQGKIITCSIAEADYTYGPVSDNQTISASVALSISSFSKDSVYSSDATIVIGDCTPPQLELSHTTSTNPNIQLTITDHSAYTTTITLNNVYYTAGVTLAYAQAAAVTATATDALGNYTIYTTNWITDKPTPPIAPTVTWVVSTINTDGNQFIKINRPVIPAAIDAWIISMDGKIITQSISSALYTYGPVSDNQTITVAVAVLYSPAESTSNYSPATTVIIPDRTAPIINNFIYDTTVTSTFTAKVTDASPLGGQLLIKGQTYSPTSVIGDTVLFALPAPLHYGLLQTAKLTVTDNQNNIVTKTYSWTTDKPQPPLAPTATWIDQLANSTGNQIIHVVRPDIPAGIDTWIVAASSVRGSEQHILSKDITSYNLTELMDNQTVAVAIALADSVSNSTSNMSSITSVIISDRTAPLINAPLYSTDITPNIAWAITDAHSAMDWSQVHVLIQGALWPITTDNTSVAVQPIAHLHYGETVAVTLSIKDVAGNYATKTLTYTMDKPTVPGQPIVTWIMGSVNSAGNQFINITRPDVFIAVDTWVISTNGRNITQSITETDYTYGPVSDNQTLAVAIALADAATASTSNYSDAESVVIPNRSLPVVILDYTTTTSPDISLILSDVSPITDIALTLNGIAYAGTYATPTVSFTGLPSFHYGQPVAVTATVTDAEGNYAIVTVNWYTDKPEGPSMPAVSWIPGAINSSQNQQISITRPDTIDSYIDAWAISVNGSVIVHPLTTSEYTYGPVADYQNLPVAVAFLDTTYESTSNYTQALVAIADRTAPEITQCLHDGSVTTTITIKAIDVSTLGGHISVNGQILFPTTVLGDTLVFNLNQAFHYSEVITAEVTVTDNQNNNETATYTWTTIQPETPLPPTLVWIDGGINSTMNQYIKIMRPVIPVNVDAWVISIDGKEIFQASSVADYSYGPINDNQSTIAAVALVDTTTASTSNYSEPATQTIADRTPPTISEFTHDTTVTSTFIVKGNDLSPLGGKLSINGQSYAPTTIVGNTLTFLLPQALHWGMIQTAEVTVTDNQNNNVTESYSWTTDMPAAPAEPVVNWLNQGINTTDNQVIRILRPTIPAGIDTWVTTINSNRGLEQHNVSKTQAYLDIAAISDNQTITVSIALADSFSGATSNFSMETTVAITDRTPPVIENPNYTPSITPNISWKIMDAATAIDWTQVAATIRNTPWAIITDNETVTISTETNFHYGEIMAVTLSIKDIAGNSTVQHLLFTTEQPPTPSAPSLTWLPSALNSTNNQYVRVERPTLPDDIETWAISFVSGNGLNTVAAIPISTTYVDLGPVVDNQDIALGIQAMDTHTNSNSDTSALGTLRIGDRTPPVINSIANTTEVFSNITANIHDTHVGIDTTAIMLLINGEACAPEVINLPLVAFNPTENFHYGLGMSITLSIADLSGNTTFTTRSWTTDIPPIPETPIITWLDQGANTGDTQKVVVTRPNIPADIEYWAISVSGNNISSTFNIPAAQTQVTFDMLPDDQTITASIQWRDSHTDSYSPWSLPVSVFIHDRTAPSISTVLPVAKTQRLESPTTISFVVTDTELHIENAQFQILANELTITPVLTIISPYQVALSCQPTLDYWTTYNVTINVIDQEGNYVFVTTNFKTTTTDIHDISHDAYYRTIAEAFSRMPINSELVLAPRIYTEHNLSITKSFTVTGYGATIDAEALGRLFTCDQPITITLNGLTLVRGFATLGGVVYDTAGSTIVLTDILMKNNGATLQGGCFARASIPTNIRATRSTFDHANVSGDGGVFYDVNVTADHCIFTNNYARDNGAVSYYGNTNFRHCILYANTAPYYVISRSNSTNTCSLTNSIIWNNATALFSSDSLGLTLTNCNVQPYGYALPGLGNISAQPQFANMQSFTVLPQDAGIDKGILSLGHTIVYDAADIGIQEYANVYISDLNLNTSINVDINPKFTARIRDTQELIATATITITINNIAYTGLSLSITNNAQSTTDMVLAVSANTLPFNQVVTFAIQTKDSLYTAITTGSFTTRAPRASVLAFTTLNVTMLSESALSINIRLTDEVGNPVSGSAITFALVCNTNNATALVDTIATTNTSGYAVITINVGPGTALTTINASVGSVTAPAMRIASQERIRFISNPRLNKSYLSFSEAFTDTAITTNDTLVVSTNYSLALSTQRPTSITWPNVQNLTLNGSGVSITAPIIINISAISVNITNLIMENIAGNAIQATSASGTKITVSNCTFNNTSATPISVTAIASLFINNSSFSNNNGSSGGAVYALNVNAVRISDTQFNNNGAANGGAIYADTTALIINKSRFSHNTGTYGGAIYVAQGTLSMINTLIDNNGSALYVNGAMSTFNFCTIADNTLGLTIKNTTANIYNSLFWNTSDIASQNALVTIRNSLLATNPLFSTNYALSILSPALEFSTENLGVSEDLIGTVRPQWTKFDAGAYEFIAQDPVLLIGTGYFPTIQAALDAADNNSTIQLREQIYALATPLQWPNKNNITLIGNNSASRNVILIPTQSNKTIIRIANPVSLTIKAVTLASANNVLLISAPTQLTLDNTYIASSNASSVTLNGSLIYSTASVNVTINNAYISNMQAAEQGALCYTYPASLNLYINNTTLTSINALSSSYTLGGGAIAVTAAITIAQSTINNCQATLGGAFKACTLSISNTLITNCQATNGGFAYGSAISVNRSIFSGMNAYDSAGVIYNCVGNISQTIFYNNHANLYYSSITDSKSALGINNSIFYGNGSEFSNPAIVLTNCLGDHALSGLSTTTNPGFINAAQGDYRVTFNSPAIDTGITTGPFVYDGTDIGAIEYTGTLISVVTPTPNSSFIEPTATVTIRIRNAEKRILANTIVVTVNGVRYTSVSPQVVITDNSTTTTDMFFSIVPTPAPRFSARVTVSFAIDTVSDTYTYTIRPPQYIYISNTGDDNTNDGSTQYPFKTLTRAAAIARDNSIIIIKPEVFTESFVWPTANNVALWGTTNATIVGTITIPALTNASIIGLNLKGTIQNNGQLLLEQSIISQSITAINNTGTITGNNLLLLNNVLAINNTGTANIAYSNLLNNTTQANGSGIVLINDIVYGHTQLSTMGTPTLISCLTTTPGFTDNQLKLIHNSPAVDMATNSWVVTTDYRGMPRPQHALPDIGAYESDVPALYVLTPATVNNLAIETTLSIRVVDTKDQIPTAQITGSMNTVTLNVQYIEEPSGYQAIFTPSLYLNTSQSYTVTLSARDTSGNSTITTLAITTEPHYTTLYVDALAAGLEAGNKTHPYRSVQSALNYADARGLTAITINIAAGTYTTALTISANPTVRSIALIGTGNCVFDGNNSQRILTIGSSNNCVLEGITFTRGNALGSNNGGALSVQSALITINTCAFTDNKANGASGGGAIYNNKGTLVINNTSFINNVATRNGGVLYNNRGNIFISDSLLKDNSALLESGGAIYNYQSSIITLNRTLLRNNQVKTVGQSGGAIYNTDKCVAINSIFDDNTASTGGGGAIYNYNTGYVTLYFCNIINNTTLGFGGGIYNYNFNANSVQVYSSVFFLNTASDAQGNIYSPVSTPLLQTSFPQPINNTLQSPSFNNVLAHDYHFVADSACIDTATAIAWIQTDYEGKTRPIGVTPDMGAFEYKAEIDIPAGYIAYDEQGNTKNIASTASITIEHLVNNQSLGKIFIPSSNGINPTTASFRDIVISSNYIDIPATSLLFTGKTIVLTIVSGQHPFIARNYSIHSNFNGTLTNNSDLAITHNIVLTPSGSSTIASFTIVKGGRYSAQTLSSISILPKIIRNNHNHTATITIVAQDATGNILEDVPYTLTTNTLTTIPATATGSATITHSALAETGVLTVNAGAIVATAAIQTYSDDIPPGIALLSPIALNAVSVTTAISISITDNMAIATSTVSVLLNNIAITNLMTLVGNTYTYSNRWDLNTVYVITVNATDEGGNTQVTTYTFTTKADTSAPTLQALIPASGSQYNAQSAPLSFILRDEESGVAALSLQLIVKNISIPASSLNISTTNETLAVTYNTPIAYNLNEVIPVTISVTDTSGNMFIKTLTYTIIGDTTPPAVSFTMRTGLVSHNEAITATLTDNIAVSTAVLFVNNLIIDPMQYTLTPIAQGYMLSYSGVDWGYNKTIAVTLSVTDTDTNQTVITYTLATEPDQINPTIVPVNPLHNTSGIDIRSPIVFDIIDNETGPANNLHGRIVINGIVVADQELVTSLNGNTLRVTCSLQEDLTYLSTVTVSVTAQDNAANFSVYTYNFNTADDMYIPIAPTLNLATGGSTQYCRTIVLTGTIEAGHKLQLFADATLLYTATINSTTFTTTVNIPDVFIPGQVLISAVSVSKRGNVSATSNTLALTITANTQLESQNGITANIVIVPSAFDRETIITWNVLPVHNPDPSMAIDYMISMNPVAVYGGTPLQQGVVDITFTLTTANTIGKPYTIYYQDSFGLWKSTGITVLASTDSTIHFTTNHFSIFGIGYSTSSTTLEQQGLMLAPNPVAFEREALHILYNTQGTTQITLKVYTLSGQLIQTIDKSVGGGTGEFTWTGDTQSGQTIANGAYIVLATMKDTSGKTWRKKIKIGVLN